MENFSEEIREELYKILLDAYSSQEPETRLLAFIQILAKESGLKRLGIDLLAPELGTMVLGVLHAAYSNPAWLKMVVEDTGFLRDDFKGNYQKELDRITQFYPKRVEVAQ